MKIKNWEKWQTYRKDRGQPPWIKVHRKIMRKPKWVELSDKERGQLLSIWLLGADNDGEIPDDPALIMKLCFMSSKPNLNKFVELGFLDAKTTPKRRQHDQPKAEKSRIEKNRYSELKNVFLSGEEYKKLKEKFNSNLDEKIENLSLYIASKGDKYKSHYATILAWERNNKKDEPPARRKKPKRDLISYEESMKRLNEQ